MLLLGSPMLMDPHPSQQHAGLVLRQEQDVTRPKFASSVPTIIRTKYFLKLSTYLFDWTCILGGNESTHDILIGPSYLAV